MERYIAQRNAVYDGALMKFVLVLDDDETAHRAAQEMNEQEAREAQLQYRMNRRTWVRREKDRQRRKYDSRVGHEGNFGRRFSVERRKQA